MYADVLKKGNLLPHSKFTTEFSEICYIFTTVFVIHRGNSRFTGPDELVRFGQGTNKRGGALNAKRGRFTVLMGKRKAILLKIHYFHVLTSLIERKSHVDFKNNLVKFHTT